MGSDDKVQRCDSSIPDKQHIGVTTYDAKDPDTAFPPIHRLRPPQGAPNVRIVLLDDVGFAASSAFGGPIHTPTAERLAKNGLKFNRFHTTALSLADAAGAADRPESPLGQYGWHLRNRDGGSGLHVGAAEEQGAARHDAQAQWLLDGAVRQVP